MIRGLLRALLALPGAAFAAPPDYSGAWFDPSYPGEGLTVEQQGEVVAIAWYTHDPAGRSVWYTLSGEPRDTRDGSATFDAALHRTTTLPAIPGSARVGSASIRFSPLDSIAFEWQVEPASSGARAFRRLATTPAEPLSGRYRGELEFRDEACAVYSLAMNVEVHARDGEMQILEAWITRVNGAQYRFAHAASYRRDGDSLLAVGEYRAIVSATHSGGRWRGTLRQDGESRLVWLRDDETSDPCNAYVFTGTRVP